VNVVETEDDVIDPETAEWKLVWDLLPGRGDHVVPSHHPGGRTASFTSGT